jgi:hypothetical protein
MSQTSKDLRTSAKEIMIINPVKIATGRNLVLPRQNPWSIELERRGEKKG